MGFGSPQEKQSKQSKQMEDEMSIKLAVQMQVKDGKSAEFESVAQPAAAKVRAEDKGCEQYHLYRSLDEPTRFVLLESWSTAEDLAAHRTSAGMVEMQKIGPLLAGRPSMIRVEE